MKPLNIEKEVKKDCLTMTIWGKEPHRAWFYASVFGNAFEHLQVHNMLSDMTIEQQNEGKDYSDTQSYDFVFTLDQGGEWDDLKIYPINVLQNIILTIIQGSTVADLCKADTPILDVAEKAVKEYRAVE